MGVFFLWNSTRQVYPVDCTTFHYPQHEKLVFVARRFSASSPSAITHCTRAHSHTETREAEIQVKLFQRQLKINVKSHTTTIYLVAYSPFGNSPQGPGNGEFMGIPKKIPGNSPGEHGSQFPWRGGGGQEKVVMGNSPYIFQKYEVHCFIYVDSGIF